MEIQTLNDIIQSAKEIYHNHPEAINAGLYITTAAGLGWAVIKALTKKNKDAQTNSYINNPNIKSESRTNNTPTNLTKTIDELIEIKDESCYILEAQVTEMYDFKDIGYSGMLKDSTSTIPFICDTSNYYDKDAAIIPILLNHSLKSETPLKFTVTKPEDKPIRLNIEEITGTYNNVKYELNVEDTEE